MNYLESNSIELFGKVLYFISILFIKIIATSFRVVLVDPQVNMSVFKEVVKDHAVTVAYLISLLIIHIENDFS